MLIDAASVENYIVLITDYQKAIAARKIKHPINYPSFLLLFY
mgnify:CR=1 FL=1